ncbi:Malectin domain [Dillenia turbinata]|uniref:Malectin domain n=1 Tax=Dillenia turbinata TaxID=194707 RepID=A0AAN8ZMM0_9MAGN
MADSVDLHPDPNHDQEMLVDLAPTSPDLVVGAYSPDFPESSRVESPYFLETKHSNRNNMGSSIVLSLEEGIHGGEEIKEKRKTSETPEFSLSRQHSLELFPLTMSNCKLDSLSVIGINAGSNDGITIPYGANFMGDSCFIGGDVIRTDCKVGDGDGQALYQTARFGEFCYSFRSLECGKYLVDLHFADILFTSGPPGMRLFDVFIQEEKVVSCLDIYARVGANCPLVISNLNAFVAGDKCLSIRFAKVTGNPILCGICIRKDLSTSLEESEPLKITGMTGMPESKSPEDSCSCSSEEKFKELQRDYKNQRKELSETRRALEKLKRDNELKTKECKEAWLSLQELQNELMRKSMHVGSLAFAIEGQVKEKSKWNISLRNLNRKVKILKMEHVNLSEEVSAYKKCLGDMNEINLVIQSTLNKQVAIHEDLKTKFIEGAKERKELYNKVLELKGNIRVFCRCRPLNTEEIASGATVALDFESSKHGELTVKSNGVLRKTFKFDAVFGPQAEQADIFEGTTAFATSVLDGYNVCIFAYGQTGTGKTFTMEGIDEARGVNFRTLEKVFDIIKQREKLYRYEIYVSVLEVYNEQIRDLLVCGSQPGVAAKRLEIRQVGEGVHHVPGLVEAHVTNMNEVWEVLQTGSNARAIGSTNSNEYSSRSHCIHCVIVKGENLLNGECTRSKLWLVDLAGSERIAKTEVQGDRLKEAQNINRSLSALGDVISALATKSPHIPFRNSKLTHLLQDSLGGDSKTLMFVHISPNENDLSETLYSLNFASRVRGIELGPAKKQLDVAELLKHKQMVEKTKQEMKIKDLQIKKMEETILGADSKMKEKDMKIKNLHDKVKELESQLLIERKLARQHVDKRIAEQQQQKQHFQINKQQEDDNTASVRPPLTNRPIGILKNHSDPYSNATRQLMEKPPTPLPPTDGYVKCLDLNEKENNPEMPEKQEASQQTGRASLCPTVRKIPLVPAQRRNSLIPFPSTPVSATRFPLQFQNQMKEDNDKDEAGCLPEQINCISPKEVKPRGRKLSNILRQSLQRRGYMKSPLQQYHKRGGLNVGTEKVRVSIGSRGRIAHRLLLGHARRAAAAAAPKEIQQKQQIQKEKGKLLQMHL